MANPAEARDQVIELVSALGYDVSVAQLARWHRAGLLPRPRQRPLGRGRGTKTIYPHGTSVQVVALCQVKDEERRLGRVAFRLWWDGFAVDLAVIREQLASAVGSIENEMRKAVTASKPGLGSALGRSLGRERIEAIAAAVADQPAAPEGTVPTTVPWETMASWPPTLDELTTLLGKAIAARMAGTPMASLIEQASDEDLVQARNRARSMAALLRNAAAPMAWLYGKSGSIFKMADRFMNAMTPEDYRGMVAMMLALSPSMRPEVLTMLDAGAEPPLSQELRVILTIRDQVPGAAQVLTPMAIRACLRDKEAARRHRPQIEQFIEDHRAEIESVITRLQPPPEPVP